MSGSDGASAAHGPILAIDTSGDTASVAVYRDRVLAEATWHAGRKHSAQLLPAIDRALGQSDTNKRSLSLVAVAVGPGSYSGLRVGISTALSMALALDIGIAQVPTLDVIAFAQPVFPGGDSRAVGPPVRPAIHVGRGHYATARFRRAASHLEHETRIESVGLGELLEMAAVEHSLVAVDLDPETREHVERQYGARVELASPAASARRAGFLAELAALKIRRGEPVTSEAVEPIYLHN
jgi:tRNA threonylcarbamoyladenosine biosynthesis protein TsaB